MFEKAAAPKHYTGAHVASGEVQTGTCGEAKNAETNACVTFREIDVETQKALRAYRLATHDGYGLASHAEVRKQKTVLDAHM